MAGYDQVPVGYRFMPRDDELLLGYLRPKLDGQDYPKGIVHDCDLYGLEQPSDIWRRLNRASHDGQECTDDKDIYVFTTLNSKAPNGSRVCRTVGTTGGTWKGEDAGKKIYASGIKHPIGFKKRYTYRNKGSSQNDHWIMHEFHLDPSLLRNNHHQEKNTVLCILRRKDDISKKRKLEERDNYEENAANRFQSQALNALTVEDYNNAPSYMEQNAFDHFQPQALTATTIGDYGTDPRYTEENAANHFQPQEHYAATTGDYSNAHWYTEQNAADNFEPHDEAHNATNEDLTNAPSYMEQNAFDHFQPQALTATTIGDYSTDPRYTEENAANHFQPQGLYAATTGDYSNAHWYTEENAANHFQPQEHYAATTGDYSNAHWYTEQKAADNIEPHDEAHNATNEDLTTALRRMEEILMSGF
ncbi:unnamed protein product [Malus baccata var. baccata]